MENYIRIGGIEKFSIVDFPNVMSAVVFMQGCPWRCPFCHNVELQDVNKETLVDWNKFIEFLEHRKGILDGVVFSGGEPLVQHELVNAINQVKKMGYKIGLHTGGYAPKRLEDIVKLVDWVGLDIKALLENEPYKKVTGGVGDIDKVLLSLDILIQSGVDFECRTTCDPRFVTVEDVYEIAKYLKEKGVRKYYLQKYRPVSTDCQTTSGQCLAIIEDDNLINYLKESFEVFEVRV